jgi:hypothetical protein
MAALRFPKNFPTWSLACLLGVPTLAALLGRFPHFVERVYTHGLYAALTRGFTSFTKLFSFSVSELALYLFVLAVLALAFEAIRRREWRKNFARLVRLFALGVAWFYLSWGLNYSRLPIDEQLHLPETPADSLALRANVLWSLQNTNALWRPMPDWNMKTLDQKIESSYRRVFEKLPLTLMPGSRRPKFLLVPGLFNYTQTSGMFGPFFHEVHLNAELLPVELPFVLAHEKAHQMGFARESEASFLAALACFASADSAINYSAHFALAGKFARLAVQMSDGDSLVKSLRPEVKADFKAVRARYQKYAGAISEFSSATYDAYLKANQIKTGVANYGEVAELVMRWRRKEAGY